MTKLTVALAIVGLCVFAGCKQQESGDVKSEVASVDTAAVEKEFESAPPEVKTEFDRAITSIKSGEYGNALNQLRDVAKDTKLTSEQQKAITDLIAKVQTAVTQGASKAVEGAEKAVDDLKNTLPK